MGAAGGPRGEENARQGRRQTTWAWLCCLLGLWEQGSGTLILTTFGYRTNGFLHTGMFLQLGTLGLFQNYKHFCTFSSNNEAGP